MVKQIVGERRGRAVGGAPRLVAPGIIAGPVHLPVLAAARAAAGKQARQVMRLTATAEILIAAHAVEWPLPELAQVGVDVAIAVARPRDAVGQRAAATGAVARCRLRAPVACPHQVVLLSIAEIFHLAATGTGDALTPCKLTISTNALLSSIL